MRNLWKATSLSAAIVAALALPTAVHGQVGAFGAAAALGAQGESAHAGAPVLTESALVLGQGRTSFSAVGGLTSGSVTSPGGTADWTYFQLLLSGFIAPAEDLMVGAILSTVNSVSFDGFEGSSGVGDLTLYGKYRIGGDAETDLSAIGRVILPTGADGFGQNNVAFGGGLAVSRQTNNGSLHAAGFLGVPTGDDGDAFVNLSGAAVFGVTDRIGVSGEASLIAGSDTFFSIGPAIRFRASDNVFLDGGIMIPLVTPDGTDSDFGLLFGVNIGG